jgi:hypothetical protein
VTAHPGEATLIRSHPQESEGSAVWSKPKKKW